MPSRNSPKLTLREVKTENLSHKEIYDFFVPLGSEMDVITELKNTYIVGHKGSGKSMILKYLSLELQIQRIYNKETIPFDDRALGIFLRCDISKFGGMINPHSEVTYQSPWVKHFTHTFNLSAIFELLKSIVLLCGKNLFDIKVEEVTQFVRSLMKSLRLPIEVASLDAAINKIDEELGFLQEEYQENRIGEMNRFYSDYKFLYDIRNKLLSSFAGLKDKEIVFLLDEYNELSRDQQQIINEMIKIRQPIFKMSSLPYGYINSRIAPGVQNDIDQDFDLVYLANKALTPKSREFNSTKKFLKAICNRRLLASGIDKDVEQILEVPKPYFKHEGKRTRADIRIINEWNYCGFSNYVLLSSGNPKTILDLLQDTIIRAVEEGINIPANTIPTKIQLDSIQAFSKEKRSAVVNADPQHGRGLQRLVEYIGKELKKKSDEKIDYYRLVQIINDEKLSDFSYDTIALGLKKSVVLEAEWERLSHQRIRFKTLTLNNILLPSFELPFGSKQLWQIDATKLDMLIKGESLPGGDIIIDEVPLQTVEKEKRVDPSPSIEFYVYLEDIKKRVKKDQLVIFVGAGLSNRSGYLTGNELKSRLGDELEIDYADMTLDKVAEAFSNRQGEKELYTFLIGLFDQIEKPKLDLHVKLAKLGITRFVTTNWDSLIEDAHKQLGMPHQVVVTPHQLGLLDESKVGIFKMHGDLDHTEFLVVTSQQYALYTKSHAAMITRLKSMMQNTSVLFLGYSLEDSDLRTIFDGILNEIPVGKVSYAVFENIPPHEKDRLERMRIKVIQTELSTFINSLAMEFD